VALLEPCLKRGALNLSVVWAVVAGCAVALMLLKGWEMGLQSPSSKKQTRGYQGYQRDTTN